MADKYKTMKLAETLYVDGGEEHDPMRAYECEVCHGVSFDRGPAPGEMICSLCDQKAPLLESYRMALSTLGYPCLECRGERIIAAELGFGSFDFACIDDVDLSYVSVQFEYERANIQADPDGFSVMVRGKEEERLFADGLDAGGDRFSPRLLALEVVNRVRHDLELEYGKAA